MTLKKFITCIAASMLLAVPALAQDPAAWSDSATGLSMSNTTATGAQTAFKTEHASALLFHVSSGTTSTSSIKFEQSIDGSKWYTSATITNASAAGELWACPAAKQARFNVSTHSAGTLLATYSFRQMPADPLGQTCKKLDLSASTATIVDGTLTGALSATTGTFSGALSATTIAGTTGTFTGAITGATTIAATAGVSGTTGTFTGAISGTTGTFTGAVSGTTLTGSGAIAGTTLKGTTYTPTRVPYFSTAGLLIDASTFTFTTTGGILDVTAIRPSGLTATRVPFAGTNGLIGDITGFTFGSGALAVPTSVATTRFLSTGSAPTTDAGSSTCGTTAPSIAGKDQAGVITVGSVGGTVCHVNFNVAFANAPACTVNGSTATNLNVSTSTSILTITGTLTAAEKLYYVCFGY